MKISSLLVLLCIALMHSGAVIAQNPSQPRHGELIRKSAGAARMNVENQRPDIPGLLRQPAFAQARAAETTKMLCDSAVTIRKDGSYSSRILYTYDNGNLMLLESYHWDSRINDWVKSGKFVYTYDNGNLMLEERCNWDSGINDWVKSGKSVYTYDSGNLTLEERYNWNSGINDWVKSGKSVYTYDSGNLTLEERYNWDSGINDWIGDSKLVYTHDNGNPTLVEYYNWDSETRPSGKSVYAYDNGNLTLLEYYYWDGGINDWLLSNVTTYYYSEHEVWVVAVEESPADEAPAARYWVSGGILTVVPAVDGQVMLYTTGGLPIATQAGKAGEGLCISLPAPGIYILAAGGKAMKITTVR